MTIRAVPLQLGGQERQLRFGLSAWAAIEDHGLKLQAALDQLRSNGQPPSLKAVGLILWSMLQEEAEPPDMLTVYRWVDGENFADVISAIGDAIRGAFPAAESSTGRPPMGRGIGAKSKRLPTARLPSHPTNSGG